MFDFTAVLLLATILCLGLVLRVTPLPDNKLEESLVYIAMAEQPLVQHPTPYCYRVLVPTLARLLPLDLTTSFFALTFFFMVGTGVLVYYLLREMGMDRFISLLGLPLFYGLNWGARFAFFDFRLTDPALFFLSALTLLLLLKGRLWLAVVTLSLATLAKESALFLLPFAYTLRARKIVDVAAAARALFVGIIPVAVLLVLRWTIPGEYDPSALWSTIGRSRIESGMAGFVRGATVGTWGVGLLIVALFSGRQGRDWLVRSAPFLALVYLQPFFAINVDRLLVLGFLATVPLACMGWERVMGHFHLSRWMVVGYASIAYFLLLAKKGNNYNSPSPEQELLLLAVWTLVVFLKRRRFRSTFQPPA